MGIVRRGLPGGSFKPLSEEGIEKIHNTAMQIIEEVGFQVNSPEAQRYFEQAGATVDKEKRIVRLPKKTVMELIAKAPSEIMLCGSDEKNDVHLGGSRVYTGTGGTALYIYDPKSGEKRLASLDDLKNIAKLVDRLENIHLLLLPTYPSELTVDQIDVNRFYAGLNNTSKHIMGGVYTLDGIQNVIKMAEVVAGGKEQLRKRPIISMIACCMSPLKLDEHYADMMIAIAKAGIPLVCPAEPLCGATSPITVAGNVLMQTVDSLMGVLLSQIVNPGTPIIFGSVATSTDLRDLKYLAGSVEMGLTNAGSAQMAQYYKLPFYATGGMTDSKVLDSQSGYESAITNLLCALAGSNFIHDSAGLMEFAMTVCLEKYVIDNDILGMVMRAVEGIKVNDETLAFDLIKQVGPAGNFVTAKHTRRHMRSEHYEPTIADRNLREDWEAEGGKPAWERAAVKVKQIVEHNDYGLAEEVRNKVLSEIPDIVH